MSFGERNVVSKELESNVLSFLRSSNMEIFYPMQSECTHMAFYALCSSRCRNGYLFDQLLSKMVVEDLSEIIPMYITLSSQGVFDF